MVIRLPCAASMVQSGQVKIVVCVAARCVVKRMEGTCGIMPLALDYGFSLGRFSLGWLEGTHQYRPPDIDVAADSAGA